MLKIKCINGFSKAKVLKKIEDDFNEKSISSSGECMYNDGDGNKCGVGLFIPDSKYKKSFEHTPIDILFYRGDVNCNWFPFDIEGLEMFQDTHDRSQKHETKTVLLEWVQNNVND